MPKVGIVGTTTWGTTLAVILARRGVDVRLWARARPEADALTDARQNARFLPGVAFPPSLSVSASERDSFADAELVIIAVPSQALRANARRLGCDVPARRNHCQRRQGLGIANR